MCPLYVPGLIGPGDGKSIQPMAERFELNDYDLFAPLHCNGIGEPVRSGSKNLSKLSALSYFHSFRNGLRQRNCFSNYFDRSKRLSGWQGIP